MILLAIAFCIYQAAIGLEKGYEKNE